VYYGVQVPVELSAWVGFLRANQLVLTTNSSHLQEISFKMAGLSSHSSFEEKGRPNNLALAIWKNKQTNKKRKRKKEKEIERTKLSKCVINCLHMKK